MKKRVATHFSRAAETYADAAEVQREVALACAQGVVPGRCGLAVEIGSGGGLLTGLLRQRVSWDRYLGLDIAPGMVASQLLQGPGETLLVADGEAVPLRPGRVDLLVSASTMQWYRDPGRSIPENLALLAPGGAFSLAIFAQGTLAELARVSAETGFGSFLPMRPAAQYADIVGGVAGLEFQWRELAVTRCYPTVREALGRLQRTGATCTGEARGYAPGHWKAFVRRYEELFGGAQGVRASYNAVLLWGRRTGSTATCL